MKFQKLSAFLAWYLVVCVRCLTPRTKKAQPVLREDAHGQLHLLRICNAYTSSDPLDVSIGKDVLTGNSSIPYKSCREMKVALWHGSDIEFSFQNGSTGVFELSSLPDQSSLLLLVAYRNPHSKQDVIFHSHIFAKVPAKHSQLLVVDSYNGHLKSQMSISHKKASDDLGNSELESLQYNEVVMVVGGKYHLRLRDHTSEKLQHSIDFVANDGESYVAVRVGGMTGEKSGEVLPEELLVFPQSLSSSQGSHGGQGGQGHSAAHSRAAKSGRCLDLAVALLVMAVTCQV